THRQAGTACRCSATTGSARSQTDTTHRQAGTVGAEPRQIAGDRAKRETEDDTSDPIPRGSYTSAIAHGFGASGASSTAAARVVASCSAVANTSVIRTRLSGGARELYRRNKIPIANLVTAITCGLRARS